MTTGFTQFEFGLSAKWLEILKEAAPSVTRVAVIRDPAARSGGGQFGAIQVAAPSLQVELRPIDPGDPDRPPVDLLRPFPAEKMHAWPVNARVGNVRNDNAQLLEEVSPDDRLQQGTLFPL